MKNKMQVKIALLTAAALTFGAMAAFADADNSEKTDAAQPSEPAWIESESLEQETPVIVSNDADTVPTAEQAPAPEQTPEPDPEPEPEPDPELELAAQEASERLGQRAAISAVTFSELEQKIRAGNNNVLALDETIAQLNELDYEKMSHDMLEQLNGIADIQFGMIQAGAGVMAQSLAGNYAALKDAYDDLKDGKIQSDNAAIIRQLENAQNQIVMAGESLYTALLEMEHTNQSLTRNGKALDRTIAELELRYQLGQIPALTLQETKSGKTSLISGQKTLQMNIQNLKFQLEQLLGAKPTGKVRLQNLPNVSAKAINAMDLNKDLTSAKAKSYELFDAGRTLQTAKDDFKDVQKKYLYNTSHEKYIAGEHVYKTAEFNYLAKVEGFENKFNTLYHQVKDYQQVLAAAQTALSCEKDNFAAAQLKNKQGSLSDNKLLEAQDKLAQAQEQVDTAQLNLAGAYHTYTWAVNFGILN